MNNHDFAGLCVLFLNRLLKHPHPFGMQPSIGQTGESDTSGVSFPDKLVQILNEFKRQYFPGQILGLNL